MKASIFLFALFLSSCSTSASNRIAEDTGQIFVSEGELTGLVHRQPNKGFKPNAAYKWLDILLEASGRDAVRNKPRPTVLSRTDAMVLTAMYDAWAAYDETAVGTRLGAQLRRPKREHTIKNKETAIAYAAYRTLLFVYKEDHDWIRKQLQIMGYDPNNDSRDKSTPVGIGNVAADALIEFRRDDGANQLGNRNGSGGQPYADYTNYKPVNSPGKIKDPTRWLPIPFDDGKGGTVSPGFLTPHWGMVTPFVLESSHQFRPPTPPQWGSERLSREIAEAAQVNANLTLEQKAIVEFMREGPRSTGQSGHWLQLAQDVSRRDKNSLDKDIKLFFSVGNVVMDAFIACWEAKRYYDTGRPYWWVRMYYEGKEIDAWGGPGKGVVRLPASNWLPYSPPTFLTPPFPGYTSGHATASGAASRMLELFTGSDHFGVTAFQQAGFLTGEAKYPASAMQAVNEKPVQLASDAKMIRLDIPSFTYASEMAALSRLWGGYHIRTDNEEGLILGRKIAMYSWPKYQAYFNGSAK